MRTSAYLFRETGMLLLLGGTILGVSSLFDSEQPDPHHHRVVGIAQLIIVDDTLRVNAAIDTTYYPFFCFGVGDMIKHLDEMCPRDSL